MASGVRKMISLLVIVLVALGPAGTAAADDADTLAGATSFQFIEEPVNPRLVAMGSAGTAMPGGGFAFYNPALPALRGSTYAGLEYGRYSSGDLRAPHIEGALVFPRFFTGLSFTTYSVEGIIYADERGINENAQTSWQESFLVLNGGFIAKRFAAGISVAGMQARIEAHTAYALSASGGVVYTVIPDKLRVGAAGFHAGAATNFLGEKRLGDGEDLPLSARFGASWTDAFKGIEYAAALDITYRNENRKIMAPVGIEVWPVRPLAVRLGKRFGHDTELFNCGLGLRVEPFLVDLSFTFVSLISGVEPKWRIGVAYDLKKSAVKTPPAKAAVPEKPVETIQEVPPAPPADTANVPADSLPAPESATQDTVGSVPAESTPPPALPSDSSSVAPPADAVAPEPAE